jgi:hypothetical protein
MSKGQASLPNCCPAVSKAAPQAGLRGERRTPNTVVSRGGRRDDWPSLTRSDPRGLRDRAPSRTPSPPPPRTASDGTRSACDSRPLTRCHHDEEGARSYRGSGGQSESGRRSRAQGAGVRVLRPGDDGEKANFRGYFDTFGSGLCDSTQGPARADMALIGHPAWVEAANARGGDGRGHGHRVPWAAHRTPGATCLRRALGIRVRSSRERRAAVGRKLGRLRGEAPATEEKR